MIDEILNQTILDGRLSAVNHVAAVNKALTAIYEIGLGVIGADDSLTQIEDADTYTDQDLNIVIAMRKGKNFLRNQQRKAWAKACGVAE